MDFLCGQKVKTTCFAFLSGYMTLEQDHVNYLFFLQFVSTCVSGLSLPVRFALRRAGLALTRSHTQSLDLQTTMKRTAVRAARKALERGAVLPNGG